MGMPCSTRCRNLSRILIEKRTRRDAQHTIILLSRVMLLQAEEHTGGGGDVKCLPSRTNSKYGCHCNGSPLHCCSNFLISALVSRARCRKLSASTDHVTANDWRTIPLLVCRVLLTVPVSASEIAVGDGSCTKKSPHINQVCSAPPSFTALIALPSIVRWTSISRAAILSCCARAALCCSIIT